MMIMRTQLQLWQTKTFLGFIQSSKSIDAESDDENEMNKTAQVPTPSEMRNIMRKEDERGPMQTSASEDLFKKWDAVRAMVLEWHSNQADVSRVGDPYNDNAINYFRKILKKREKQSTLDIFFNAP
ncbi:uncharacterized protein TNCV_4507691 [Trichonephila clavipes]|nr:uncharacterized protein TNCV_4507691 [Trichonephila clavipes]